jgi:hypothetical protein
MIITIRRKKKIEAVRAMTYLMFKGWSIDYPLTEIKTSKAEKGAYNYHNNRYEMSKVNSSSVWVAKLFREDNHDERDKEEPVQ